MKFYNRKNELAILENHFRQSSRGAILDVLIGRRRIGKTELVKQFIKNKKALYFFVSRKSLQGLLEEWGEVLKKHFPAVGSFNNLAEFLNTIFELARRQKLIVIFDEFQNFKYVSPPAFSQFQQYFDEYKKKSKLLLIVVGSITNLMEKIFTDRKEPLFGRATRKIYLPPLDFKTVLEILTDLKFKSLKKGFDIFSLFNGVPKYYVLMEEERLINAGIDNIFRQLIISPESILKTEGLDLLKEEFGKDYDRYFEIMSLIARGRTKTAEIASFLKLPQTSINVYLDNLEKKYKLIERRLPLLSKPQSRAGRYYLKDVFLNFWFRFVYRHLSWIEQGAVPLLLKVINRDLFSYQGLIFENLIKELIFENSLKGKFLFTIEAMGKYWENKGALEIDLAAYDLKKENLFIAECKLNSKRINKQTIKALLQKAENQQFSSFKKKHLGIITLNPLTKQQKNWLEQEKIHYWALSDLL